MKHKIGARQLSFGVILFLVWMIASILLTVRSYSYSDHVTYSDVELSMDEGLTSMMLPLALLSPGHDASNSWRTYTRYKEKSWVTESWVTSNGGSKFMVRDYFAILGKRGNDKTISTGMFCGFGYTFFDNTWTSDSRPGPLLWLVAPVWAVTGLITFVICMALFLRVQFGLRSLIILTAVAAVLLTLPTLHASA